MKHKKITWILLPLLILFIMLFLPSAAGRSFAREPGSWAVWSPMHSVSLVLPVATSEPDILQPVPEKKTQEIEASSLSKEMGDSPFFLQAGKNDGGALSFASENTEVAEIDQSTGRVTLVGTGAADIVIRASATDEYGEASKTVRLTVK